MSRRLDLDDLASFIGAPSKGGAGETRNAEQEAQAARLAASPRVLPQDPYDLSKLRSMDADVRLKAGRINTRLPIDDMDAHLLLNDGLLQLLVELAGLDVTQSLGYLFDQDKQVPIRCAFADFGVTGN